MFHNEINSGMFLAKILLTAFTCTSVANYVFVAGQEDNVPEEIEPSKEEETTTAPQDNHTFVALIDIVFTDGRKRSCTGTIVHDYVVVTAAHCFNGGTSRAEPELTASFVVIGTKKMYDTGYENYLPIERVITHPNYRGWTADIALVYTFAAMTSDKPGNIMAIIGESTMTPVDSNVTVLSWGHCKEEQAPESTQAPVNVPALVSSEEMKGDDGDISCEPKADDMTTGSPSNLRSQAFGGKSDTEDNSQARQGLHRINLKEGNKGMQLKEVTSSLSRHQGNNQPNSKHKTETDESMKSSSGEFERKQNTKQKKSMYGQHRYSKVMRNSDAQNEKLTVVISTENLNFNVRNDRGKQTYKDRRSLYTDPKRRNLPQNMTKDGRKSFFSKGDEAERKKPKKENSIQTFFKNWRRQMGTKQNNLMVEIFGFVNVQTCKKLVDKAKPEKYSINPNQVVCYATEDHYITDEDSGAPAIRHGRLVAVTVGGVECEGDHVAIGMKMSCFCSWIAANLPNDGGANMKCCKDCCSGRDTEDNKYKNLRHRTKYL